jgi:hypothetical protein
MEPDDSSHVYKNMSLFPLIAKLTLYMPFFLISVRSYIFSRYLHLLFPSGVFPLGVCPLELCIINVTKLQILLTDLKNLICRKFPCVYTSIFNVYYHIQKSTH